MDSASLQQHYILITDIASSSRLWEDFPSDYPRLLDAHNRMIEEQVAAQGGVLHKNLGDGYLLLFASADACLRCAVELEAPLLARLPRVKVDVEPVEVELRRVRRAAPVAFRLPPMTCCGSAGCFWKKAASMAVRSSRRPGSPIR